MGKHAKTRKGFTVFEFRYYKRKAVAVWIKVRRLVHARLNNG